MTTRRPDIDAEVTRAVISAAERMRAMRARRAAGREVLKVKPDIGALSGFLVDGGWLKEWDAEEKAAIEAALNDYLDQLVTA